MQAEVDDLTFEEWWAELADAVRAWLLRRRVPPHLVDDIVQETGLRLFKMWDEIDAMRSPRGLAFTIASNLLWDERNRGSSREIPGDIPEQSCEDVERAGIARLELARVRRAMGRLNPQQRSVLLAEIGDVEAPIGSPAAVKMMRMRARRRLTAILESVPAGAFVFLRSPRQLWRAFRSARRGSVLQVQTAAIIAACTTIAVVGIPPTQPALGDAVDVAAAHAPRAHTAAAAALSAAEPSSAKSGAGTADGALAGAEGDTAGTDQVHVDVGEGTPVRGKADVSLTPADSFEVEVPTCSITPHGTEEVRVQCHGQVGDKEVEVDGSVGVGP